jgi:hypothetical protein
MTTIFINYSTFIQNLTYYAKTFKFISMFPNIKRKKSHIMKHMKYIYHKNIHNSQCSIVICSMHSKRN